MNAKWFCVMVLAFIFITACKKHEIPAPKKDSGNGNDTVGVKKNANDTTAAKKVDVYITGVSYANYYPLFNEAYYWKNGVQVPLTNGLISSAGAIAIQDTNVYILGSITTNGVTQNVYWKNGIPFNLDSIAPTGIALSGNNIYISGTITTATNLSIPVIWKNGVITPLAAPSALGQANAIAVSGNNVYVAGLSTTAAGAAQTTLWKNGVPTILSGGATPYIVSMTVDGSDVYVVNSGGSYWKNGVNKTLSNGEGAAYVAVYGSDIYITSTSHIPCGCTDGYITSYTKNDTLHAIGDGFAGPIAINGQNFYMIGNDIDQYLGTYWTNDAGQTPNSWQVTLNGIALMRH